MKFHSTFLATATAIALGVPTANAIVYEFTPADNAEIDQLKTIVVYTADEEDMIAYRSKPVIKINGQDVSTTANTSGEYFDVLTFTLDQAYTTPGACTVTIPPRTFYYGLYETNNAEITLHYNIKGTSQGGDDPTPGKPFDNPGATINPQQ
ncbi:MAG: hypothetical protein K2O10_04695 [Muribaculaceae bacterium]|nr:hypothetical protein [Muribaculaceae bacterium]